MVDTPQQNVVSNKKNRILIGLALYMLINAHLFKNFCGKDLLTTNYLQNKVSNLTFLHKTTREMWYGIKPNLSYLHVFGRCVYTHIHKDNKCKINSHTQECIFLGSKFF